MPASKSVLLRKAFRPTLDIDFTDVNASLDSRITFTRASTAYRYKSDGILESLFPVSAYGTN